MDIRPMAELQEVGAARALWFSRRYVALSQEEGMNKGIGETARDLVSRFVLGELIYDQLSTTGLRKLIQTISQRPGSFDFLMSLQSYTLAQFNRAEIDEIADNFSWVFAPRSPIEYEKEKRDLSVLPDNLEGLKTTPDEIYVLLKCNTWMIPLLLLSTVEVEEIFPAHTGVIG